MINKPPITHVAIRFNGEIYSLPAPNRHYHIIRLIAEKTGGKVDPLSLDDEGFLDQSGRYLTREQALLVAKHNNQIKDINLVRNGILTSEDIW